MISSLIFLSLAAIFCVFGLVYPYAIYPVILKRIGSSCINSSESESPTVTLVFCAFNEKKVLLEKLENIEMLKARYPEIEVLAFDDGSTDGTFEILAARSDLLTVVRGAGRNGKAFGMKTLASQALGEVLIFTDANVLLAPESIENLLLYYSDEAVGGVCGSLKYIGEDGGCTAAVGSAYWKIEEYLKKEESRTGNVMGADGSIFSIRKSLYPQFPDTVLDDLTVSMSVVFAGKRLIKAENVVALERLVTSRGEEFTRKIRIATRAYHTHMYLRPQLKKLGALDKFKYFSRKFIRWYGALFFCGGMIFGISAIAVFSPVLALIVCLLGIGFSYIGVVRSTGIVPVVVEVVIAMVATILGVFRASRGKSYVTWSPAKTR